MALVQALIAGTKKYFPNGSFTLGNVAYTTATLIQALESLANAIVALNAAQASAKDAKLALETTDAKVAPIIRDYKRYVLAAFGNATQQLADFGMQPPRLASRSTAKSRRPPRRRRRPRAKRVGRRARSRSSPSRAT